MAVRKVLSERITPTLFLVLAVGGALLVATPRRTGAAANCKPQRAACKTNQDCCSGVCTANVCGAPHCQAFPATGQMTCWDRLGSVIPCAGTGQDGDLRKGAPLSYTDNGDGTITDNNTGLMWEKLSHDGSIHDVNNTDTWDDA